MSPISMRVSFALAALWQFIAWGGRISLLTEADRFDWWNWTRIGGSLLMGVLLAFVEARGTTRALARRVAWLFLVFAVLLWGRSLMIVWTDASNSFAFSLVHTGLALVTWALAAWCVRVAKDPSGAPRPSDG